MEIYVFVYLLLVATIIFEKEKYSQNIKNNILIKPYMLCKEKQKLIKITKN